MSTTSFSGSNSLLFVLSSDFSELSSGYFLSSVLFLSFSIIMPPLLELESQFIDFVPSPGFVSQVFSEFSLSVPLVSPLFFSEMSSLLELLSLCLGVSFSLLELLFEFPLSSPLSPPLLLDISSFSELLFSLLALLFLLPDFLLCLPFDSVGRDRNF